MNIIEIKPEIQPTTVDGYIKLITDLAKAYDEAVKEFSKSRKLPLTKEEEAKMWKNI